MIRITSKRDGFRRAGMAHPKGPMEYPDDRFSEDQLTALKAEAMLIVEEVREEAGSGGQGAGSEDTESVGLEESVGSKRKPRKK